MHMRNISMSQGRVTLKIAPEMSCFEVPLSGVMLSNSLIKTSELLYSTISPCHIDPSSGLRDTRIRVFHENGVEISLGAWEDVVHAGMVAVIEFIPIMIDRRRSEPAYLDGMPLLPGEDSFVEDTHTPPSAMSPPHKSVSLERYPSSKLFTPNRPSNIRIHSLPSICEQANPVVNEEGQHIFPRSVTPLPSPQPWKLLFNRAKARGPEKSERDYFSSRPAQPTLVRRWSEPSWVGADSVDSDFQQPEHIQQSMEAVMDIDMGGTEEEAIIDQKVYEPEPKSAEVIACEGFQHQMTSSTDLFSLQATVGFSNSKRKRGYGTDSEDDGDDVCRRTVKRSMASYHRRQLHGLLQAV